MEAFFFENTTIWGVEQLPGSQPCRRLRHREEMKDPGFFWFFALIFSARSATSAVYLFHFRGSDSNSMHNPLTVFKRSGSLPRQSAYANMTGAG